MKNFMNKVKDSIIILSCDLLVVIIFYLILCCHLECVLLCDDESVEELKELIKLDTSKYVDLMAEHAELQETVDGLESLAYDKLLSDENTTKEDWDRGLSNEELDNATELAVDKLDEAKVVYDRIFATEAKIQESEAEYWCQVPKCHLFDVWTELQ